jgi:hypothetical protein
VIVESFLQAKIKSAIDPTADKLKSACLSARRRAKVRKKRALMLVTHGAG